MSSQPPGADRRRLKTLRAAQGSGCRRCGSLNVGFPTLVGSRPGGRLRGVDSLWRCLWWSRWWSEQFVEQFVGHRVRTLADVGSAQEVESRHDPPAGGNLGEVSFRRESAGSGIDPLPVRGAFGHPPDKLLSFWGWRATVHDHLGTAVKVSKRTTGALHPTSLGAVKISPVLWRAV